MWQSWRLTTLGYSCEVQQILNNDCDCSNFHTFIVSHHHGSVLTADLDLLWRSNLLELFSKVTKVKSCLLSIMFAQKWLRRVSVYLSLNIELLESLITLC
jgi:hypothetical protein